MSERGFTFFFDGVRVGGLPDGVDDFISHAPDRKHQGVKRCGWRRVARFKIIMIAVEVVVVVMTTIIMNVALR